MSKKFVCFFVAVSLFVPCVVLAEDSLGIVISKIAWAGSRVENIEPKNWWRYEWFELYNNTDNRIVLDGWTIEFWREKLDWTLSLEGEIGPQNNFLIVSSDKIFSDYNLNYSNLSGKLINGGQEVILKDCAENIIDSIDCFSFGGWFAGDNETKQTMERIDLRLSGSDPENWKTDQKREEVSDIKEGGKEKVTQFLEEKPKAQELSAVEASVSPVTETEPKKASYPSGIFINEVLPSPDGPDDENEWIEIFNANEEQVDISLWEITDAIGNTVLYVLPENTIIDAQNFLVLHRPTTKITLNNKEDELNLIRPDGVTAHTVAYNNAPRGQSLNRTNSNWIWRSSLTPGFANIIDTDPSKQGENLGENPAEEDILVKIDTFDIGAREKGLAKSGSSVSRSAFSKNIFLALGLALFSAIAMLILKKKLWEN